MSYGAFENFIQFYVFAYCQLINLWPPFVFIQFGRRIHIVLLLCGIILPLQLILTKTCFLIFFVFVLISGALTKSQFPVFTIYAQRSCLSVRPCSRAWCIDRVQNYKLAGFTKRSTSATSRQDCFEMCLGENEFTCR